MTDTTSHLATSADEEVRRLIGVGKSQKVLRRIVLVAGGVAGAIYLALLALTIIDITARYFQGRGVPGGLDIVEVVLPIAVFLAMGSAELSGTHVRTPLITNRLPDQVANVCRAIAQTIASLFIAWMTYASTVKAFDSILKQEHRFALINIPVWPGRVAMVLGLVLFLAVLVAEAVRSWRRVVRKEAAVEQEMEGLP